VGELLSPDVPPARRSAILDDAEHEFANFRYPEYKLVLDRSVLVTRNDDGSLTLEPVRAVYRYESKSSKLAPAASEGRNSFRFTVVRSDGRWLIAESDLFDTFSRVTQAGVFSWAFFVIALSVVVIFFWGWMVLDCSIRYRNWKYSVALILTLPLGALYYFFTVWLRRPAGELGD